MPLDPATGNIQVLNGVLSVGRSIFDFYAREWAGVDPSDGAPMWYQYYDDVNNNGVFDATEPNGWSYFSLKDENYRKNYYAECCDIKSTIKYNDKAATESLNIIKNIFGVK